MKRIVAAVSALLLVVVLGGCSAPAPVEQPQTLAVPQLEGMALHEMIELEEYEQWKEWFTFAEYVQVESITPVGTILAQTPAAGTAAPKGTVITLTVSKAGAPQTVPSVAGLSLEQAAVALEKAGYIVKLDPVPHDTVEAGVVIGAEHEGEQVPAGSEILLTYSSGPAEDDSQVTRDN